MMKIRMLAWMLATGLLTTACAPTAEGPSVVPREPEAPEDERQDLKKPVRPSERGKVSSIGFDKFYDLHQQGRLLVIDSRPAYYHQLGHIPGAISLPKDGGVAAVAALEDKIASAIADGKTVAVYCSGILCADARIVARRIAGLGHPVSIFSGGWDAWQDAGLPTE